MFRDARLAIPSATTRYSFSVDEFKGLDKASGADNFSPVRATEMHNFLRSKVGEITKRGGFETTERLSDVQWVDFWNGYRVMFRDGDVYFKNGEESSIISTLFIVYKKEDRYISAAVGCPAGNQYHILCKFVSVDETYLGVVTARCTKSGLMFLTQEQNKAILQTKTMETWFSKLASVLIKPMRYSDDIPIPLIASSSTAGSGNPICSPNLLTPLVREEFTVPKDGKRFELSLENISMQDEDGNIITAEDFMKEGTYYTINDSGYRKLTATGVNVVRNSIRIEVYTEIIGQDKDENQKEYQWKVLDNKSIFNTGTYDFVNPEIGAVWIPTAKIPVSPVEGEASVRITYIRNYTEYIEGFERLLSCNRVTRFGVGGYKDRTFLAVDNRIYYSGMDEALYFGELCYVEPCTDDKRIMAMGGQGQVLYAVDSDGVTYAISGTVTEDIADTFVSEADFIVADMVQGEKPVGSALSIFGEEFCYLSESGVVAIRHDNFYDKRYAQNRSRLLGEMLKGRIVDATVWGNFLVIAVPDALYLLDEMQQTTLKDYVYSGRQYEVFPVTFADEIDIKKLWTDGERLCVYTGSEVIEYKEERKTDLIGGKESGISCEWVSQVFSLSDAGRWKNILHWYLSLGNEGEAVKVYYSCDNHTEWKLLKNSRGKFRVFDYKNIDYGLWTYCTSVSALQMMQYRRPSRRFRTIQFKFEGMKEHPITLAEFGFNYEQEVI